MWETSDPVDNTLETTLQLFPFAVESNAEEPTLGKHSREEDEKNEINISQNALQLILSPSPEDSLVDSMDRLLMGPKRYKPSITYRTINPRALGGGGGAITSKKPAFKTRLAVQKPVLLPAIPEVKQPPKKVYVYMDPNEFNVQMVVPYALFPYQVDAVKWIVERETGKVTNPHYEDGIHGCMLAMFMGLGKTPVAATVIARTLQQQRAEHSCSMYVCPKTLIGTVRYELQKFFGDQLRITVYNEEFLRKSYNTFGAAEIRKYDVVIANYDSLSGRMSRQPTEAVKEFCAFNWFRIILDESHEIRERNTARFRAMMLFKSARRICMTGSVFHNSVRDLYNQMEFTGFRIPRGTKPREENLDQLGLYNMIHFVDDKVAKTIELPKKHVEQVFFDLSEAEKKLHRFYVDFARSLDNTQKLQQLVGLTRVLQVCSAPYLVTPASKTEDDEDDVGAVIFPLEPGLDTWIRDRSGPAGLGSSKMRAFVQLMQTIRTKVVVFANKTSTLRLAQSALGDGVIVSGNMPVPKREELFTQFRTSPTTNVLFITLKLGSTGLNLTEASSVVFLEPWYNHALLSQGESRVHRIGQTQEVHIYYMLAKDSAEERVYKVAQNKHYMSEGIKKSAKQKVPLNEDMRYMLMEEC